MKIGSDISKSVSLGSAQSANSADKALKNEAIEKQQEKVDTLAVDTVTLSQEAIQANNSESGMPGNGSGNEPPATPGNGSGNEPP